MGAGVSCFDAPLAGPPFPPDLPLPVDILGIGVEPLVGPHLASLEISFPGLDFSGVSLRWFPPRSEWISWRLPF